MASPETTDLMCQVVQLQATVSRLEQEAVAHHHSEALAMFRCSCSQIKPFMDDGNSFSPLTQPDGDTPVPVPGT